MTRLAILDDYQNLALQSADWAALGASVAIDVFTRPFANENEAADRLAPYDILCIMRERTPFPKSLLQRLPNLKLLVSSGVRNLSIDLHEAKARGIVVSNTTAKDQGASTLELIWALILATARHIPHEEHNMREGRWQDTAGVRLAGKTLGLIGLGKLGQRVADIGRAFGMQVIAWSQNLTEARAEAAGVQLVTKEELLREADVVSIHLVLSDRTRHLIGAADFALMKKTALFINTSRGPIVEEAALVDALQRRVIAGCGLDIYDVEPVPADHILRRLDNAVVLPHLGYVTSDNLVDFYVDMVEDVKAWMAGAPIRVSQP
jgi:phosphoglycerate dehydrogenase-like enzyme